MPTNRTTHVQALANREKELRRLHFTPITILEMLIRASLFGAISAGAYLIVTINGPYSDKIAMLIFVGITVGIATYDYRNTCKKIRSEVAKWNDWINQ